MDWKVVVGEVKPQLSVSDGAPPDVATIGLIAEGGVPSCPWSVFQVHFGNITTPDRSYEREDVHPRQGEAPRERSRDGENRKGKNRQQR